MDFHSLESLVPEITGIDKNNTKHYDAAHKSVQRIDAPLRKISSYHDTNGIPDSKKDEFVSLVREIYEDYDKKKALNKFSLGKVLSEEETLLLFDTFVNNMKDENEKAIWKQRRDELKGDTVLEKVKEINQSVLKVVNLTDSFVYKFREGIVDDLKKDIQKILDEYEEKIHEVKIMEDLRLHLASIEKEEDRLAEFDKLTNEYTMKKKKNIKSK
ncbi:hypothetical protein O2H76_003034 [Clostridioides difficile]|nr:hypothetical protein [Clostridioides difficile]